MDFRVQAQIGYYTSFQDYIGFPGAPFTTYTFHGEVSGWSETQTLTIPSALPSPTPFTSPEPESFPTITTAVASIITILIIGLGIGFFLKIYKKK